jgi:hypothetical protein
MSINEVLLQNENIPATKLFLAAAQPSFRFTFFVLAFWKFYSIIEFHTQISRVTNFAVFEVIPSSSY